MQIPFVPGVTVRARGRLWRLGDIVEHRHCVELHLSRLEGGSADPPTVLVHPFDRVSVMPEPGRPTVTRGRTFCRALADRLIGLRAFDRLAAPVRARLDLLPYQLEPAIAMALEGVPRVLLADAVGLGKTVQAGLVIAELFARGRASRGLVLVPASLRDQWLAELRTRFDLDATVVDAPSLRTTAATLPRTVGPWTVSRLAIVSIDFAKRQEVIAELATVPWDLVVVDEAHTATQDSGRYRAAHRLACRASHVVLLTATPHSGDAEAFGALTRLGACVTDEPLVLFRRSRREAGPAVVRRARTIGVRLGPAERALLTSLLTYLRTLWRSGPSGGRADARLVATLLLKRALSTPQALLRSVLRRRALLCEGDAGSPGQLPLEFGDDVDAADTAPESVLAVPGLPRMTDELAWLDHLATAAAAASRESRKLAVLERLVRRVREPVIVFTEYRDTLALLEQHLGRVRACVSLHGGLDQVERRAVLSAFTSGRTTLLLATDAAGMGLNLHERCRVVVNLELPWNPVRLEQRIGRVDRLGQHRVVHAIHLVGRESPEARVLARLLARSRNARTALHDENDDVTVGAVPGDDAVAETLLGLAPARWLAAEWCGSAPSRTTTQLVRRPDLAATATGQVQVLERLRHLVTIRHRSPRQASGVSVGVSRRGSRHQPLAGLCGPGAGTLAIFEHRVTTSTGAVLDESLLPFVITGTAPVHRGRGLRAFARHLADELTTTLRPVADDVAARRFRQVVGHGELLRRARASREAGPVVDQDTDGSWLAQPGLFDRRIERALDDERDRMRFRPSARSRAAGLFGAVPHKPRLRWILVQRPPRPGSRSHG